MSQLLFDAIVISLLFWNAFSMSRAQSTPLIWELRSGGIGYFVVRIDSIILPFAAHKAYLL